MVNSSVNILLFFNINNLIISFFYLLFRIVLKVIILRFYRILFLIILAPRLKIKFLFLSSLLSPRREP